MRRINLTPEELKEVIRLRQGGLSWLGIQNMTGISRRTAQRSFELWQKSKSVRELDTVRARVTGVEFERHVEVDISWGQLFLEHIMVKESPSFPTNAEKYIDSLMDKEIPGLKQYLVNEIPEDRRKARNRRQNMLVSASLVEHTANKIQWENLSNWKSGWDTCKRVYPNFKNLVIKVVGNTFNHFPDLGEWFISERNRSNLLTILEEEILDILWKAILKGELDLTDSIKGEIIDINGEEMLRITFGSKQFSQRRDREREPSFVYLCHGVIKEIWEADETGELKEGVGQMQVVVEEMEAVLEPLILRPLILHGRCKICPA